MPNIDHTGFQELLYDLFHGGKSPYPVADIATLMGVDYQTLSGWSRGKNYFPPDLLRNLYNATVAYDVLHGRKPEGAMRIWEFILEHTGLRVVPMNPNKENKSIDKMLLDTVAQLGHFITVVETAVEDDLVDAVERELVVEKGMDMIRKIEGVMEKARGEVKE